MTTRESGDRESIPCFEQQTWDSAIQPAHVVWARQVKKLEGSRGVGTVDMYYGGLQYVAVLGVSKNRSL